MGVSSAELLLGCCPRSHFDLMLPNLAAKVRNKQVSQKSQHDKKSRPRTFTVGANVFVRNFSLGSEWLLGTVVNTKGPVSYIVKLKDGHHMKRHVDHLRPTAVTTTTHESTSSEPFDDCIPIQAPTSAAATEQLPSTNSMILRRSTRVRTVPNRLTYPSN